MRARVPHVRNAPAFSQNATHRCTRASYSKLAAWGRQKIDMAPLIVQIVSTLLARWFVAWRDAARIGLAVMFLFTGGSHFSSLKYDFAAMIPPPLTGALWLIYATGLLEIAGAIGLLTPKLRRPAAWGLAALLVALFPANVYAAFTGVTLGGAAATSLWLRAPLQLLWIAMLWKTSLARRTGERTVRHTDLV
jgi:uncharacterized membrane protein